MDFDFVVSRVNLIDGSGKPAFEADVAVKGDRIVAIGNPGSLCAEKEINGKGLVLAPGFIDVHTHDDTNVIRHPECLPKISQGVTTVLVGNCGISASPALLKSDPPDPMNLLGKRSDFDYPSFAEYVHAVEKAQPSVNVAALVGHTTLRNNVMDDLHRAATELEVQKMQRTLRDALEQGALGLSSGLAYASANSAPTEELKTLTAELRAFNGIYTTHLRSEFEPILEAMEEAFDTASHAKVPVVISHLKCAGAGNWGRTKDVIALMDTTAAKQDIGCDCYPYTASSSTLDLKQVTDDIEIFITWSEPHPEQAGKTLKTIAEDWSLPLMDAAKKLQPAGAVYHCMADEDVERVLQYRLTMIGSDGLPNDPHPHPRLWGAFPRVLGHYSREQKLLSLEVAVHKMTGLSASRFNLKDRGVIREGALADLVLFNPETIRDSATFEMPTQAAQGIIRVWVNGTETWTEQGATRQRAGRFLRRNGERK
ncbi:D-aminoacylase [Grimontia kaedaensis]|uniref:D-aminoacylase n=1 Tax=Grimontia kaedaensis TaxID=2872157 RepID=A0ABY4X0D6_9GAMM|nr:D-aminoacylase [Grimontia kaedaensis]USH04710.1 D-aminoacylase [Grimontia kaedaensis]